MTKSPKTISPLVKDDSQKIIESSTLEKKDSWLNALIYSTFAQWFWTLSFIFGGCCSNAYALEVLVTDAPKSGNLITFSQFLLVATEGLIVNLEFSPKGLPGLKERKIPISRWLIMVVLFFFSSQLNNMAFAYKIPMTLHIIFRSGSLIANMLLGVLVLGKRYSFSQASSIFLVTVGVLITTFSTVNSKSKSPEDTTASQQFIGVGILTVALLMAAFLGIVQEVTYNKYGKHWREGLFYTHALSLPFFFLYTQDIVEQVSIYASSDPAQLPGAASFVLDNFGISKISKLFFYLLLNVGTQYFCVSGVQRLSSMSTALTLNLVLTIRKMASILFSVIYFRQPVNLNFVIGTVMAFSGTFIYSMASMKTSQSKVKKEAKKSN